MGVVTVVQSGVLRLQVIFSVQARSDPDSALEGTARTVLQAALQGSRGIGNTHQNALVVYI